MMADICAFLHNYFEQDFKKQTFSIDGGLLSLPENFIKDGQYFRICGSVFNDGIYKYPATNLTDETFSGVVWALAVPPQFAKKAEEISAWVENPENKKSQFDSESFGGYSYHRKDGAQDWRKQFAEDLAQWRKI